MIPMYSAVWELHAISAEEILDMFVTDLGHSLWLFIDQRRQEYAEIVTIRIGSLARLLCNKGFAASEVDLRWGTQEGSHAADAITSAVDLRGLSDETLGIFFVGLHELRSLPGSVTLENVDPPPVVAPSKARKKGARKFAKGKKRKSPLPVQVMRPGVPPPPLPIELRFLPDRLRFAKLGPMCMPSRECA